MKLAEETLCFDFLSGGVTPVTYPHVAGWRQLPHLVTAHTTYESHLRIKGQPDRFVRHGETLCLCLNVNHQIEVVPGSDGISRWSHVSFTILGSVDLFSLLEPPPIIHGNLARQIGDANQSLAEISHENPTTLKQLARKKALGFRLLELVLEQARVREGSAAFLEGAQRLAPVLDYIDRNVEKDLGREKLASLVHLSPTRFYAVFVAALGVAPSEYVQRLRLQRAQQLLLGSELSIKEISAQVGHSDPFHFSRIFKRECGTSPQHYRTKMRKMRM
jgi:AraC-like DNA-binding protein